MRATAAVIRVSQRVPERLRARLVPVNTAVLVLGSPKSGTSVIAAALGRSTRLSVTLDLPALFGDGTLAIHRGSLVWPMWLPPIERRSPGSSSSSHRWASSIHSCEKPSRTRTSRAS